MQNFIADAIRVSEKFTLMKLKKNVLLQPS
jgi:hypothetical protein